MQLIYQNFDGLDVSFQGTLPPEILQELENARLQAERQRSAVTIKLGIHEIPVAVAETGMRGGYRYRFDTGLEGEVWFIANSNAPDQWNIRTSVKSLSLALYGYRGVKKRIYSLLEKLGAIGTNKIDPVTGEIDNSLKSAISRVDYCFDFKTANFQINPDFLIAHSRTKKQFLYEKEFILAGRNIAYCRIGSMPNKQIVFYDKIREMQEKNKPYWWHIWALNKSEFNEKIWRIEVRAGKKELKNWNLRTFEDFEEKIGNVISSILSEIKYVTPNINDSNSARWPIADFWYSAQKSLKANLIEYTSSAEKGLVIRDYRDALKNRYKTQISGMLPAYTAITGKTDAAEIPGVIEELLHEFSEQSRKQLNRNQKKLNKAHNKFVFINETENKKAGD